MEPIGEIHIIKMTRAQLKKAIDKFGRFERISYHGGNLFYSPPRYKSYNQAVVSSARRRNGSMSKLIWGD